MSRARPESRSASLVHPIFWAPAAAAVLQVPAALLGMPALPLALFGIGIGTLAGMFAAWNVRASPRTTGREEQNVPPEFATDPDLAHLYQLLYEALVGVTAQPTGGQRYALTQKLIALGVQFRGMASGTASFTGPASWYVAHDAVLAVPNLREYRALVRVGSADCVQNPADQLSLRATFAAAYRGVLVERILVLPDALWPPGHLFPNDTVRPWIEDQHNHGLRILLLRESELGAEPGPPGDTCVFGDWGVGTRTSDTSSQTIRVGLDFDPDTVRVTLERLDRLGALGIPFGDLLDRAARRG